MGSIFVASTNSGGNHDPTLYTNNTYFHSTFNSYGTPQLLNGFHSGISPCQKLSRR